jgi:hypothetical protein
MDDEPLPPGLGDLFAHTAQTVEQLPARQAPVDQPNFEEQAPGLGSLFRSAAEQNQQLGGGVPQQYAQQMMQARNRVQNMDESTVGRVMADVPFFGTGFELGHNIQFGRAQQRIAAGNPEPNDFFLVAQHERLGQIRANESEGEQHLRTLEGVARLAGEAYIGGSAVAPATQALAGGLRSAGVAGARGVALRAAETGARSLAGNALSLAATPTMWAPAWTERNLEWNQDHPDQPRSPVDPRGLPPAIAMGLLQNAIFGRVSQYGNSISGTGMRAVAARTLTRLGAGMLEQEGVDVLASGISEALPRAYRLQTGYGALGNLMNNPDSPAALRRVVGNGLALLSFAAMHEAQHGGAQQPVARDVEQRIQRSLNESHAAGASPEEAAANLQHVLPDPEQIARSASGERFVDSPATQAMREAFPNAENTPRGAVEGRVGEGPARATVEMNHDPATNTARIDFYREKEGIGSAVQPFSKELLANVNKLVEGLHARGVNIKYVAKDTAANRSQTEGTVPRTKPRRTRADVYADALTRAGYEQIAGPVGESGLSRTWRPRVELTAEQNAEADRLHATGLFGPHRAGAVDEVLARAQQPPAQSQAQPTAPQQPSAPTATAKPKAGTKERAVYDTAKKKREAEIRTIAETVLGTREGPVDELEARLRDNPLGVHFLAEADRPVAPRELMKRAAFLEPDAESPKLASQDRPGATISPPADPMDALRQRHQAGERVELADVFEAAGLTEKEQHVIRQRLAGRSHEDIRGDAELVKSSGGKYTRQRIEQLEASALEKMGTDQSLAVAVHGQEQTDRALDMIEKGQRVNLAELRVDPQEVAQRARTRIAKLEAESDAAVDQLLKELEDARQSGREPDPESLRAAANLAQQSLEAAHGPEAAQGLPREPAAGSEREAEQPPPVRSAGAPAIQADAAPNAAEGVGGPANGGRGPSAAGGQPTQAGDVVRPQGWDTWTPIQRAQWARAGDWMKETLRLKFNGHWTVHQAIRDQGGIDPRTMEGPELERWRSMFGNTIFQNEQGKRGTQPVDRIIDHLFDQSAGRAVNTEQPSLLRLPEGADPTAHLFELLRQHTIIDGTDEAWIAKQELSHMLESAHEQVAREFPSWGPEKVEREVARLMEQGQAAGEAEGRDSPIADSIAAEERSPSSAPDTHVDAAGNLVDKSGHVIFRHAQPGAGFGSPLAESERAALPGGGQENAPSAEQRTGPTGPRGVALANEITDKIREKDGKSPILRQARQANPEVWDSAMSRVEADPQVAARLVEDLAKQIRPTSVEENALLLHERVALSNEHSRSIHEAINAAAAQSRARRAGAATGDLKAAADAAFARESALSDRINRLDKIIVDTGSEWGRAGQFRKQLVAEDYSLSGMLQKAQAAAKRPLTDAERQTIATLQAKIEELNGKLDAAEAALAKSGGGSASPVYGEWQEALTSARGSQQEFQRQLTSHRWETLTTPQKVMDWLRRARIAEVISSPVTAGKVGASSAWQLTAHPLRELIGSALRTLPGIRQVAAMAPVEGRGFNAATEAATLRAAATQGVRDGWATIWHGRSQLDVLHGVNDTPRTWLDLIGNFHAAEKAPAVRGAYERAFRNIEAHERAAGRDVTTPAALESIGARAYQEGVREKFQQDNAVVTAVDKAISSLKRPENSAGARALGHAADLLLPVRRTPTNIVADAFEHVVGLPVGAGRAGIAWAKGVDSLTQPQAESIMRMMKKGTLGLPLLAMGLYASANLGGGYSGRRREDELKPGEMRLGKLVIPAWATAHHPAFMALQLGATIRRAQQNARHGNVGAIEGTARGLGGLIEEVPFVRQQTETARMMEGGFNGNAVGNLARSFAIPQLIQWLAQYMDRNDRGDVRQRNPHGLVQRVEVGVPGLRQNVPLR